MNLKDIIASDIMSKDITTISQDEKVSTAEIKMVKKNVGGLPVVSPSNELIGIITQRDIQLSRYSVVNNSAVFHVDDLMSRNPISAKTNEKLVSIVKKMVDHNIERIPIIDDNNKLIGLITMKDIIHTLGKHLESS